MIRIDYDFPGNPFWLRRLVDEVRVIAPGRLLGQATYAVLGAPRVLLRFAMDRIEPEAQR